MKSVFMCEHCGTMGPPEKILEHENICLHNLEAKICQNCKHFRCLEKEKRDEEYKKLIKEMSDSGSSICFSTCMSSSEEVYRCVLEKTSEHCINNASNYFSNYEITPIVGCDSFEKRDEHIVWKSSNIMMM